MAFNADGSYPIQRVGVAYTQASAASPCCKDRSGISCVHMIIPFITSINIATDGRDAVL